MFQKRISAFRELGRKLSDNQYVNNTFGETIERQYLENSWFIPQFSRYALDAIAFMLSEQVLNEFSDKYQHLFASEENKISKIAVVSAGNIPLAAFHDFFCVLVSGNCYIGKLSSQDKLLLPILAEELIKIEPNFSDKILFTDKISNFDAVIASGSNNTSRYFEYYFKNYPNILRKHRNSLAILSGNETDEELQKLCEDIYLYFGLGCRSVSKIFIPKNFDLERFIKILSKKSEIISAHHQFLNNIDYQKTVHLMNKLKFLDAGTFLLVENADFSTPIGILAYEYYDDLEELTSRLSNDYEHIQCIVSNIGKIENRISFGEAQRPTLTDYADGIDVMEFLLKL